ncbi:uncharacterized protein LOC133779735 [Humulus lupulus]|uniref:uncharacterized protein LOC133779735 n=1 Tax=Humulus lupulus TaxID=3486 RepID=UPI002B40F680|nr:uncharacterized protein LOC133779735 [Humulus lupulus]
MAINDGGKESQEVEDTHGMKEPQEVKDRDVVPRDDIDPRMGKDRSELQAIEELKELAVVLEEKKKLAEELKEKQKSLDKAIDQRDQFKESNRVNFHAAKQLEEDLVASRQENTTLEGQIEELEKANANNLERNAELARCAARMAEEERARIPASPEISLATGMDGADNEAEDVVDQGPPQDPPAPQDPPTP